MPISAWRQWRAWARIRGIFGDTGTDKADARAYFVAAHANHRVEKPPEHLPWDRPR